MAARAYWKGQIRLALVSIPVEIYSATKSGASKSMSRNRTTSCSAQPLSARSGSRQQGPDSVRTTFSGAKSPCSTTFAPRVNVQNSSSTEISNEILVTASHTDAATLAWLRYYLEEDVSVQYAAAAAMRSVASRLW